MEKYIKKFWDQVILTADDSRCWFWTGYSLRHGYGALKIRGKWCKAHRFSWMLANHRSPTLMVLHKCGTPSCVNPNHLYEGTALDNARDRALHGKSVKGQTSGMAQSTDDEIRVIKRRLANGEGVVVLAKEMGCSKQKISSIKRGTRWTHISL